MDSIFQQRSCLSQREVEQYLHGTLSNRQRHEIENHLLDCALCSSAIEGYWANPPEKALESVAQLRAAIAGPGKVGAIRRLAWINYAAAIALLLVMVYAGYRYWEASQRDRLFTQYFEPTEANYLSLRSADQAPGLFPPSAELQQALAYYETKEYSHSLPHFANYLEEQASDWQAMLLAANAALQAGQEDMAEQYLLQVQQQAGIELQPAANWYLALTYLKQGKEAGAKALLEKLAPQNEEARQLLRQLSTL